MTLWLLPERLMLELDRPAVELLVRRCASCRRLHACWLDSETGRHLAWARVGAC